jgi:hypothetical protein
MTPIHKVLSLLGVFTASIVVGGLLTDYTIHRLRVDMADGAWCTRFLPNGNVENLYGENCPTKASLESDAAAQDSLDPVVPAESPESEAAPTTEPTSVGE